MTGVGDLVAELRRRRGAILAELGPAATAAGRAPDSFRVVAVTKGVPVEHVSAAAAAGLAPFGESRVQEALPKVAALPDAEWHFIGRLQANKARAVVRAFPVIHSVDSVELLARIDRIAVEEQARPRVLLQVNVSGEARKAGFETGALESGPDLEALRATLEELRAATVGGLMTIAPMVSTPAEARPWFRRLREMRDGLEERIGQALPDLSMGMSGDAEAAIAEGATLVRVGTRLFWGYGARSPG